jgi:tripartite ATP-independent transporter DctM subunit
MTPEVIGFSGLGVLFALLALRVPIGLALVSVSFTGIWAIVGFNGAVGSLKIIPYSFAANWQLSSVPMFLFMGFLCYHAGITKGLFQAARVWLSRLPGGLAIASVFGASGFAAITGSSLACSAAMGRIAIPEMTRSNYSPALATGTVAAAGTIGALIPPSILFIMYGILAQQPIGNLFLGGVVVGIMSAVAYIATILLWVTLRPQAAPRVDERFTVEERLNSFLQVLPAVVMILGVFGGLFSGLFTATEAGAVGSALSIIIAIGMRTFNWENLRRSLIETLTTTSAILLIAVGANLLARFIALSGAGDAIAEAVAFASQDPVLLLFGITAIYLVLGCFIDPMGAMMLTLPILLPIVDGAGINLIWFGIFAVKLLEIGMITPPVGLNVFVIKSVVGDKVPLSAIFRGVTAFLAADLVVVLIMTMFPNFVLILVNMVK